MLSTFIRHGSPVCYPKHLEVLAWVTLQQFVGVNNPPSFTLHNVTVLDINFIKSCKLSAYSYQHFKELVIMGKNTKFCVTTGEKPKFSFEGLIYGAVWAA